MFVACYDDFIPGDVDVRCGLWGTQETDCVEGNLKLWACPNECAAHWLHLHVCVYESMYACECVDV